LAACTAIRVRLAVVSPASGPLLKKPLILQARAGCGDAEGDIAAEGHGLVGRFETLITGSVCGVESSCQLRMNPPPAPANPSIATW